MPLFFGGYDDLIEINEKRIRVLEEMAQRLYTEWFVKKLKGEKLVPGWREWEPTRAGVKVTISDVLYSKLPEPTYSENECEVKGLEVYNFVYEHYKDASNLIGAEPNRGLLLP